MTLLPPDFLPKPKPFGPQGGPQHPAGGPAPPQPTKPAAPYGGLTQAAADYVRQVMSGQNSARTIIMNFLNQYGLGSLAGWAWTQYIALGGGSNAINQIQFELPNTPQFQARFPAYKKLAAEGHVMSPADMIALEKSYGDALHGAGIPPGFYDSPADFAGYMLNNTSPSEIAQRAQLAASIVFGDPENSLQLSRMGIPTGHQIAYALDATHALPAIQSLFLAAQDAAAAHETGFGQLTRAQGIELGKMGVTTDQARTGFNQLAMTAGLMRGTAEEGTNISANDQIAATFQGNAQAQLRIQNRQAQRLAAFKGGAGFNAQNSGVAGLGSQE